MPSPTHAMLASTPAPPWLTFAIIGGFAVPSRLQPPVWLRKPEDETPEERKDVPEEVLRARDERND